MPLGLGGGWLQRDVVAEGLELGDEAFGVAFGVAALEVVAAEVVVGLAGGEHVPVGDQHRVLDGAEGAATPSSAGSVRSETADDDLGPRRLGAEACRPTCGAVNSGWVERANG